MRRIARRELFEICILRLTKQTQKGCADDVGTLFASTWLIARRWWEANLSLRLMSKCLMFNVISPLFEICMMSAEIEIERSENGRVEIFYISKLAGSFSSQRIVCLPNKLFPKVNLLNSDTQLTVQLVCLPSSSSSSSSPSLEWTLVVILFLHLLPFPLQVYNWSSSV